MIGLCHIKNYSKEKRRITIVHESQIINRASIDTFEWVPGTYIIRSKGTVLKLFLLDELILMKNRLHDKICSRLHFILYNYNLK